MNKSNLTYFKKRLLKELEEVSLRAKCSFDGLYDSEDNLPDPVDRASSFIDRSLSQSICDRENLKFQKIEQALQDLAKGGYGICRRCGENIAIKRLKANPVASHCINCKTEIENRERLTGS